MRLSTIAASSLFEAAFKRLFQRQEKLFGIESAASAELHPGAAGGTEQAEKRQENSNVAH
jgi:hypothetical protein